MKYTGNLPPIFDKYFIGSATFDSRFFITPAGSRVRRSFLRGRLSLIQDFEIDDRVFEWIDLFEAIDAARDIFTMVELGAGYGRWIVAAAVAAKRVRNMPSRLVGVEAEKNHFAMMKQHFRDNGLDPQAHTLIEAAVAGSDGPVHFVQGHSEEWWGQAILPSKDYGYGPWPMANVGIVPGLSLATILRGVDFVDFLDMDVQGAEAEVVRGSEHVLSEKVKRVHIGTHSPEVEEALSETFARLGWRCRNRYPCNSTVCTEFGEISLQDGVQSWVNSKME